MEKIRVNAILVWFLAVYTCYAFGAAPLRLLYKTSTPSSVQGILQIYYNGTWGTICDDYWDMTHTNIACKQLGYVSAAKTKYLGLGSDPIWLDNVKCNGNESSLDQCQHQGWGKHDCSHSEDVGIVCYTGTAPLRLQRKTFSPSLVQGILQIYHNGQWGTICNRTWNMSHTSVACKQLGFKDAKSFKYLGRGSGPVWLDNVNCNGKESSLHQCQHRGWGVHSCSHSQDVGIVCNTGTLPLRLLGKTSSPSLVQGILQIYYNGQWGTICDDIWDMTETNIACKQLGYERAFRYKHLGQGPDPIWLGGAVQCNGGESSLNQCEHLRWGNQYCTHSQDIGIVCYTGAAPLRLLRNASSQTSVQGILQIYHNGQWGTICKDNRWSLTETYVACKQLGYESAVTFKHVEKGEGPIWLNRVKCNGNESSLDQCQHRGWGIGYFCHHGRDVSIMCSKETTLRLLNKKSTPSSVQGVLQIYQNGQWGTICANNWGLTETNIACKQLRYKNAARFKYLGQGSGPIWLDDVNCNGKESSFHQCQHRGWGVHKCSHRQDVGIVCNTGTAAPLKLMRRTSSPSLVQGILQINYNGQWGTICYDNWYMTDTNIACKQLGYVKGVAYKNLGEGSGPIWLDQVKCNGGESSLNQCHHVGWGTHYCTHKEDVGIVCYTGPPVKARLIGDVPNAGRVQLLYKGVWKNLCHSGWYSDPAKVICRTAGYPDGFAVYFRRYEGSGKVWLSRYNCYGYETSIESCRNLNWGKATCSHNMLAGVVCKSGSPNVTFRLVNGSVPHAGRLEMRYYGLWRPVFLWKYYIWQELELNDVHTVCRMMGYNHTITFNTFKEGRSSYRVGIHCQGFEKRTEQCRWFYVDYYDYYQGQNTWIVCQPYAGSRSSVRLMDGGSLNKGRVEIGYSGAWGTVSDRYKRWNLTAANIVCRMLGYRNASWTGRAKVLGNGFIMTAYKHCTGNETSLEYCEYYPKTYFDASSHHSYDVGVRCASDKEPVTLQIGLEKGTTSHSGRVGVRYGNSWSTLCYEGLDYPDVKVICRMLGYVNVVDVYAVRTPSSANGRAWLSGVECNGTEASILNCSRTGWWQTTCDFDAVITCKTPGKTAVEILLENSITPNSGRVGIRYGNTWGTLCNKGMDMNNSKVICRMLGYVGVSQVFTIPGNGTIWLSDLECGGAEDSIVDCRHSGWWKTSNCTHDQDVAVTCNLADAPHFQISSSNDITDSAVIINLAKAAKPLDERLKSTYQFVVEKGLEIPSPTTSCTNASVETCSTITKTVFNDSYIAAELPASPNDASSFTIGDSLYYHDYHNIPLEPGCVYRVHVRIVTIAMDGKKIFGKSSFVRFATTSVPVENPPEFQISDSRSIRQKSAKITFLRKQQRKGKVYKRWYQIVVERTGIDVFLSTKDMRVNHSYIAAEIPTTSSTFTIGDGLNYHGYNNTPLEPGCNYKVYVRVVTMTSNEKRVIRDGPFVSFTTKSGAHGHTQGHSDKNYIDPLVIGLAVLLVMSIVALIGHIVYHVVTKRRKKERKRDDNPQIEMSDLAGARDNTGETSDQQQDYPPQHRKTNAVRMAGNDSNYQSLVPQKRSQQRVGFGEESAYHISNVVVRPGKLTSSMAHMEEPIYENTKSLNPMGRHRVIKQLQ